MNNFLTDAEFAEMFNIDIDALISSRLDDFAEQIKHHHDNGEYELANMLHKEGLELANCADSGASFFYVRDLTSLL